MRTGNPQIGKRFSCLAIAVVTLWLGGFGCALCCVVASTADYFSSKTASSCHSTRQNALHSPCATASGNPGLSASYQAGTRDCSLLPSRATGLGIIPRPDDTSSLPEATAMVESIVSRKADFLAHNLPENHRPRHLTGCTLLI
jgi:hypothetical protein